MTLAIIKLVIASLVPILATVIFYKIEKKGILKRLAYWQEQIIIGFVFGIISILGTEFGIPLNGVLINCRDAAPITAGLIFGGPAGIIAGLMGGIERWLAVYWGAGTFTRVACSVSTCIAGFYAAFIRKVLFENKRPRWGVGLACGVIMEVLHLTMVIITNFDDASKAVTTIDTCLVPMVIANGLSVMFSTIAISVMDGNFKLIPREEAKSTPIFMTIQKWLMIILMTVFGASMLFNYLLELNLSLTDAINAVNNEIDDVKDDITDVSNTYMRELAYLVEREIAYGEHDLDKLASDYALTDICVVDNNGIIIESNIPEYIGFDMASGEQSAEFLCLLNGTDDYVQPYGPIALDSSIYRKYAGVATKDGFIQISYDGTAFQKNVISEIRSVAKYRHIGKTGGIVIFDDSENIVSISSDLDKDMVLNGDLDLASFDAPDDNSIYYITFDEEDYYGAVSHLEGYYILALCPVYEAQLSQNVALYVALFSTTLIFAIMFAIIYLLIKHLVVNQIEQITGSLSSISQGNLNEIVDVRTNQEFSSLSDDINTTVNTLKQYIAEAAARIDKELELAKNIQFSALPASISQKDSYDIQAFMCTAKEVGGDFYDFYITNDNTLNFLIADVSGKGIPAAMFMMQSKSVLKSLTEEGRPVNEVFFLGNNSLCERNDAGMFVTAWQGALDLDTGKVNFANAGHNLPAIRRVGGQFELLKQKVNLVLAGMDDIPYAINELQLNPGDEVFLYTDGVTEATNSSNELFGDDRLVEALNNAEYDTLEELINHIMDSINGFVKEADQFDDITMLALKYKGPV